MGISPAPPCHLPVLLTNASPSLVPAGRWRSDRDVTSVALPAIPIGFPPAQVIYLEHRAHPLISLLPQNLSVCLSGKNPNSEHDTGIFCDRLPTTSLASFRPSSQLSRGSHLQAPCLQGFCPILCPTHSSWYLTSSCNPIFESLNPTEKLIK